MWAGFYIENVFGIHVKEAIDQTGFLSGLMFCIRYRPSCTTRSTRCMILAPSVAICAQLSSLQLNLLKRFCTRQHYAIARIYYRPSVRLSVRHTGGSVKNA